MKDNTRYQLIKRLSLEGEYKPMDEEIMVLLNWNNLHIKEFFDYKNLLREKIKQRKSLTK